MSGRGVLPIVECGDPVLRRPAEPVDPSDLRTRELRLLVAQMRATMEAAPGVGLAAPQVGAGIQLAVLHDGPERWGQLTEEERTIRERNGLDFTVLVNPTLRLVRDPDQASFYEGCLSVPGLTGGGSPPPGRPGRGAGRVRPARRPGVLGVGGAYRPARSRPPSRPPVPRPGPDQIAVHRRQLRSPVGRAAAGRRGRFPRVHPAVGITSRPTSGSSRLPDLRVCDLAAKARLEAGSRRPWRPSGSCATDCATEERKVPRA